MSFQIDLDRTLETAEGLYLQLITFKNVPIAIREILSIQTMEIENKDSEDTEVDEAGLCLKSSHLNN
jgi:hypothetical protein